MAYLLVFVTGIWALKVRRNCKICKKAYTELSKVITNCIISSLFQLTCEQWAKLCLLIQIGKLITLIVNIITITESHFLVSVVDSLRNANYWLKLEKRESLVVQGGGFNNLEWRSKIRYKTPKYKTKEMQNKLYKIFTWRLKNDRGSNAGAITACSSSLIFIFWTVICQIKLPGFYIKLNEEYVKSFWNN